MTKGDTLGLRLALTFLAVALAAVALLAGLTAALASGDVSSLADRQRTDLANAIAVAAGSAWDRTDSWASADLSPVLDLAQRTGLSLEIRDATGRVVASSPGFAASTGPRASADVVVRDQRPGVVLVTSTGSGLGGADDALRTSLLRAIAGAAGLAALLALLVALLVSRRITRPVTRLIESARAMSSGNRQARVGPVPGAPAELRDLAVTFDQMADSLDAQEQLRRNLVADVAHELRTPVAVLQANTEALLDGIVPHTPEQTAALHEEVLRLGRMVDDLQTLAAAEAAALQLSLKPCDLAVIAAAAADDWEASFAAAGVRFEPRLEPTPVRADPGRLHQVIANLLSNALKFTPRGGRVQLTLTRAGGQACLQVSDTGPGIEPGDQPHVFERFWRGNQAGQTAGSGIGLAVAAELARAQQGTIELSSEIGRGTQFTLILPLAPETAA
jgi:two-component system, OmpR family, sensor histidine kinase BaeS